MICWLKSEEGKLLNLNEVTEIYIDENGWKIKTYQLCADNNLIKKFDKKEDADKSLDFLFDILCGKVPHTPGSLDFSKEIKTKEKAKENNQRGIQLKEVENGETRSN